MSNSKDSDELFNRDQPVKIVKRPPLPQAGYGLIFSQDMAQQISEFVETPLYKRLKKLYASQAKDRTARTALNSAQSIEWLSYYKGIAAAADLFFKDMEATKEAYLKANSESDKSSKNFKK